MFISIINIYLCKRSRVYKKGLEIKKLRPRNKGIKEYCLWPGKETRDAVLLAFGSSACEAKPSIPSLLPL